MTAKEDRVSTGSRIRQGLLHTAFLFGMMAMSSFGLPPVQAAEKVQLPTVAGPIPMTGPSRAFWDRMGPPREAALKAGYVEEVTQKEW
jgi:hypothetical protein